MTDLIATAVILLSLTAAPILTTGISTPASTGTITSDGQTAPPPTCNPETQNCPSK